MNILLNEGWINRRKTDEYINERIGKWMKKLKLILYDLFSKCTEFRQLSYFLKVFDKNSIFSDFIRPTLKYSDISIEKGLKYHHKIQYTWNKVASFISIKVNHNIFLIKYHSNGLLVLVLYLIKKELLLERTLSSHTLTGVRKNEEEINLIKW